MKFKDKATLDKEKKLISFRDGVQEYLGVEIGQKPEDAIFLVYRSPETIKAASDLMQGIAVTDEHVDIVLEIKKEKIAGEVLSSEIIDYKKVNDYASCAVSNSVLLNELGNDIVKSGRLELSLGYDADLVESKHYDFEQKNIIPHHLAIVEAGRCGGFCSFKDELINDEKIGAKMNLEQLLKMVNDLPEMLKGLEPDELKVAGEAMEKIAAMKSDKMGDMEKEGASDSEAEVEIETADEDTADTGGNGKQREREDTEVTQVQAKDSHFIDKAVFDKAIADAKLEGSSLMASVMSKAVNFLDSSYTYAGKKPCEIMRDAIATQTDDQFSDSELQTAFKMLKANKEYNHFTDEKSGSLVDYFNKKEG